MRVHRVVPLLGRQRTRLEQNVCPGRSTTVSSDSVQPDFANYPVAPIPPAPSASPAFGAPIPSGHLLLVRRSRCPGLRSPSWFREHLHTCYFLGQTRQCFLSAQETGSSLQEASGVMRVVGAGADGYDAANGGNGRGDRLTIFLAALLAVLTTFNDRLQWVHRAVLGN